MDFSFTSDQEELKGLAARILSDRCTHEHLKEVAASESRVDLDLWRELAGTGLVGIGMPESAGGGGLGFTEVCIVLEEVGRTVAPVPALPVMAMVGPFLAEHAPDRLDGLASGERIVSVALHEPVGDVLAPATSAADGRLTGTKIVAPFGMVAEAFLVSATDGVYWVDASGEGVTVARQDTTDDIPDAMVVLESAPAVKLSGIEGLTALVERGEAAQAVIMAGITDAAIALTAEYVKERVQFDRALATFQAVGQRAADARIDSTAIWLTAWQAVARLDDGLPAAEQVASAKFWAADGGQRVVHACVHLHGGVGVDRDYPLHRYYLWAKELELWLGGATANLLRLGKMLADTPVDA